MYRELLSFFWAPSVEGIPMADLRRPDPILFFGETVLYEDELHDSGLSLLTAKARRCLLCRFSCTHPLSLLRFA
jgi:type 2A phosphatase activator TIP41